MPKNDAPFKREILTESLNLKLPASLKMQVGEMAAKTGDSMNEIGIRAIRKEISGKDESEIVSERLNLVRLRDIASVPCGPWAQAMESAYDYFVTPTFAADLGIATGDFKVQADGNSMVGAGINDGDYLIFRPLENNRMPANRDICAVQIFHADGTVEATVKHWHNTHPHPSLTDGDFQPYEIPKGAQRILPLGVLKSSFRRY